VSQTRTRPQRRLEMRRDGDLMTVCPRPRGGEENDPTLDTA
jgi:hypothetical protein